MTDDVTVVHHPPGRDEGEDPAWRLKERIRRADDALKQPRHHFRRAYRRQHAYLAVADDEVLAFGVVGDDGYLSLFGVSPTRRREGLGTRLLDEIEAAHGPIRCHTRATNCDAVAFYRARGFVVDRRIDAYYPDGTDGLALVSRS